MLNNRLLHHVKRTTTINGDVAAMEHAPFKRARRTQLNITSIRQASTTTNAPTAQYHIPKRLVHIGLPVLITFLAILRFTDPNNAPQLASKPAVASICSKTHARDLDRYIKANLDGIADEHLVAWNRMYNQYKTHRKNEGESERIEKENAQLLAQYARVEENRSRSTKMEGVMATYGGNRNISHRPETVGEAVEENAHTFRENLAARWVEAKRKITKVTKGSALF